MTFQEKLVILRKTRGLTQDEFASAVGVSRQAVYKWESGQSYPEVQKLLEMKTLFSISIDNLLDDTYEVARPEKKKRKRAAKVEKAEEVKVEVEGPKIVSAPKAVPSTKVDPTAITPKESTAASKIQEMEAFKVVVNSEPVVEPKEEAQEEKKPGSFFGRFFSKK